MSAIGDAISAVKEVLLLTDDVKKAGVMLETFAKELRDQDRRIIRLEAFHEMQQKDVSENRVTANQE